MTETQDVIDVESAPGTDVALEPTVADLTPARVDHGALVTAAAPAETIVAAFIEYQDLSKKLLVADDYQSIEGKSFKKKSAYRKLAVAFGVSFKIVEKSHDRDDLGRIVRSEFTVQATAPNGRFMDGYGACSVYDRCKSHGDWPSCRDGKCKHCGGREGGCDGFHHFSKPEHDVPATAETRAKNRAASDLFGMGEVSAEEVDAHDPTSRKVDDDRIKAILAAAKGLRAKGYKGEIGDRHNVLGVELTFIDEADGNTYISLTEADADALMAKIESIAAGLAAGAENDGGVVPDNVAQPHEAPDPGPSPSPDPAADGGSHAEAVGDAGGVQAADPPSEPAPPPAPPTEPKADPGETARLAIEIKRVWPKDPGAALARHAVVDIVSNGRTRSSTELTQSEVRMAIKVAKGLTAGTLGFGVYEPRDAEEPTLLADPGAYPADDQVPTVLACVPEGGTAEPGESLLMELGDFLGAGLERGKVEVSS